MIARSLDVYVLLKLLGVPPCWTYAELAKELDMSSSELHASIKRSKACGLLMPESFNIRRQPFFDYLVHCARYAFPALRGPLLRGIATSHAAMPLKNLFASGAEAIPVWPDAQGSDYGYGIEPLHPKAPHAALRDPAFRELLVLVDALRDGRARERNAAKSLLERRILRPNEYQASLAA